MSKARRRPGKKGTTKCRIKPLDRELIVDDYVDYTDTYTGDSGTLPPGGEVDDGYVLIPDEDLVIEEVNQDDPPEVTSEPISYDADLDTLEADLTGCIDTFEESYESNNDPNEYEISTDDGEFGVTPAP